MPRKPREDFEGAWHHVMNRGIANASIFESDHDRVAFLGFLSVGAARGGLEVHGYCLLGNHYHLLVRSREGRLSDGMKWLAGRYTQHVNYGRGRDGPIFRGRFTSIGIDSDAHLVRVSRYIHLNPVHAGLAVVPEAWPWSSAAAYLGSALTHAWLHTDLILNLFGPTASRAAYRDFVSAGIDPQTDGFYSKLLRSEPA